MYWYAKLLAFQLEKGLALYCIKKKMATDDQLPLNPESIIVDFDSDDVTSELTNFKLTDGHFTGSRKLPLD